MGYLLSSMPACKRWHGSYDLVISEVPRSFSIPRRSNEEPFLLRIHEQFYLLWPLTFTLTSYPAPSPLLICQSTGLFHPSTLYPSYWSFLPLHPTVHHSVLSSERPPPAPPQDPTQPTASFSPFEIRHAPNMSTIFIFIYSYI